MAWESVAITKEVGLEIQLITYCNVCDQSLSFEVKTDSDGDIVVTVDPCRHCIAEAKESGDNG